MTLREKLELAGYRLRALSNHMPTEWQRKTALSWADDAVRAASVGRNPKGEDPQGLRAEHEHAVPSETSADAQTPFRDESGNATSGNPCNEKERNQ